MENLMESLLRYNPDDERNKPSPMEESSMEKLYTCKNILISDHERLVRHLKWDKERIHISYRPGLPKSFPVNVIPRNRLRISQLSRRVNEILIGKFFLCRTITVPIRMTALMCVVEEPGPKSLAVCLALYNYEPPMEGLGKDPAEILPAGIILVIKNPLFRRSADRGYTVRCDNPNDVVEISEATFRKEFHGLSFSSSGSIELCATVGEKGMTTIDMDRKCMGEDNFKRKNYNKAIELFTEAIESDPSDLEALVQRAAVYLRLKVYNKCLRDAETALNIDPIHLTATLQKISSLIGMNEFVAAMENATRHIEHGKTMKNTHHTLQLERLFENAELKYKQKVTGNFDMLYMIRKPYSFIYDFADYYGNVKIIPITGKGRGAIATKTLLAGELVFGNKALCVAFPRKELNTSRNLILDTKFKVRETWVQNELTSDLAHRLIYQPELGEELYNLYAGPDTEDQDECNVVNMSRIYRICNFNRFSGTSTEEEGSVGIWTDPSYLNHSCYDANCIWQVYGNMMFVRARRDIDKGEEISISYINIGIPYKERMKAMAHYGFVCGCTQCSFESKEDEEIHERRQHLLKKFDDLDQTVVANLTDMKICLNEVLDLRPENPEMNSDIVVPLYNLARKYETNFEFDEAIRMVCWAHSIASKTVMADYALECSICMTSCYLKNGELERARDNLSMLKDAMIVVYGIASKDILKFLSKDLVNLMSKYNVNF